MFGVHNQKVAGSIPARDDTWEKEFKETELKKELIN